MSGYLTRKKAQSNLIVGSSSVKEAEAGPTTSHGPKKKGVQKKTDEAERKKRRRLTEEVDAAKDLEKVNYCRYIEPVGFTVAEYQVCQSYMYRRDFEFHDPIPNKYKKLKAFIDEIRCSKGYGVTIVCPQYGPAPNRGPLFIPLPTIWEKDPKLKIYINRMVDTLLVSLGEELKKQYNSLGLSNLVRCSNSRVYLLSVSVEQQTITPTLEKKEPDTVEAMFSYAPIPMVPEPFQPKHFKLKEWKLKRGSQVLHYSASAVMSKP